MRLLYFIFFSLGLPLILQATVSDDGEILQKPQRIMTNVTTCRLSSQGLSSGKLTTIEVSAKNGKMLILDGMNLSKGFSVIDNNSSQDGSTAILEAVIIRNFNIDYNLIESISNILNYYCKTLNVLIIDSCSCKLLLQLSNLSLKVKKLKIINSDLGKDFLTHFETIDELSLHHSNLALIDNPDTVYLNIKKLEVFNSDLSQSFLQFLNLHRKVEELIAKNCRLLFDSVQNVSFGIKRLEMSYCSPPECFNQFLQHFELLEEFIFDNCSRQSPNFGRTFSTNIKKLHISNCLHVENMLNAILFNSKDTLEELAIDHFYFTPQFIIYNNFKLKKLLTAKITYCALDLEILKKTLNLFPSSLQTLELSHLCINSSVDNYQFYGWHLILDFSYLNVKRFTHLKNLTANGNDIIKIRFENFEELEEFECDKIFGSYHLLNKFYDEIGSIATEYSSLTLELDSYCDLSRCTGFTEPSLSYLLNAFYTLTESDDLFSQISESIKSVKEKCSELCELQESVNDSFDLNIFKSELSELSNEISKLQGLMPKKCPRLSDTLSKLKNLKRIKLNKYDFRNSLNYFVEENIVIDSDIPLGIFYDDLPNIPKILSNLTNVSFSLNLFTADSINRIQLRDISNFEHLQSVTFPNLNNTFKITFMNRILSSFHCIRTINVNLRTENITENQIIELFDGIENYDKIENVNFEIYYFNNAPATCEFIIQILKRVPNLKYLSFEDMRTNVIGMLFNRLQDEQLKFPNLKGIDTNSYDGSINLLLWFIQMFPIEELNIESSTLLCDSNELLNNFLNKTLRKLRISRAPSENDSLLKKCFDSMINVKELYLEYDAGLITLFINNCSIEKVIFENTQFNSKYSEIPFAILKTFKSLKCIYVEFYENSHSYIILAFKRYFKDREVELIFYSKPIYFQ